jgi:hypothetical protein
MKRYVFFALGTIALIFVLTALACTSDPGAAPSFEPGLYTGGGKLVPDVSGLEDALDWITANDGTADTDYTIVLDAGEGLAPRELKSGGGKLTLTLQGYGAARTVSLAETGNLFRVFEGVTLVLDENITLEGREDNTASLVAVDSGGELIINRGAMITGNIYRGGGPYGGGVAVQSGGSCVLNGGAITGNKVAGASGQTSGGGIVVRGTFTMNSGEITHNRAEGPFTSGAGVAVWDGGIFTMKDGKISWNVCESDNSATGSAEGGGVRLYKSAMTFSGGEISGNKSISVWNSFAGGVSLANSTMIFSDGKISGNTIQGVNWVSGGGVRLNDESKFTMNGGTIAGNIAQGNADNSEGGGVSLRGAEFRKTPAAGSNTNTSGTIYGSDAGTDSNKVIDINDELIDGRGHAVYTSGRDLSGTVGPSHHLDSESGAGF